MEPLIYDCEIIKLIPQRDGTRMDGYEYCAGWDDHANMGLSVIGFCDGLNGEPIAVFPNEDISLSVFTDLLKTRTVAGFNSRNFDDKLCQANGIHLKTTYDLLEEVRIAAGFNASYKSVPKGYRYNLDAIAQANGMAKTGHGELAPKLWQDGKQQEVIDYCLHDVRITRDLLCLGLAGELIDPNTQQKLKLRSFDDYTRLN